MDYYSELFNKMINVQMEMNKEKDPIHTTEEARVFLKKWFEETYLGDTQVEKDFRIQYTVFKYMGPDSDSGNVGKDGWYMECIIPGTCEEGVYILKNIEYSQEATKFKVSSWKGNYNSFKFTEKLDETGESDEKNIYLIDLYPNYKAQHFKGNCFTRGGFTGWNWLYF